jgi:hypothetical protein
MRFNDALDRHYGNLDNAFDALLDAGDRDALETEALEDEIIGDYVLFNRFAVEFCRWTTTRPYPVDVTFLEWAVEKLRREREPEHENAWVEP